MEPKSSNKRPNIYAKTHLDLGSVFWSMFDRFGVVKADAPNPQTIETSLCFILFSCFSRFQTDVRVGFDFGLHLALCWHQKWFNIIPKGYQKGQPKFHRFVHWCFNHFGFILGPMFGPFGPFWPLTWSNAIYDRGVLGLNRSKSDQMTPQGSQNDPPKALKMTPRGSNNDPNNPKKVF